MFGGLASEDAAFSADYWMKVSLNQRNHAAYKASLLMDHE
jgi:hypothetical protein